MSVIKEAVSRLDDDSMQVSVFRHDEDVDLVFISSDFACQVPFEGPDAEDMQGNRDYDTLVRAYESGNLQEIEPSELDLEDLAEQLEASEAAFEKDEVDLDSPMFEEPDLVPESRFEPEFGLDEDFDR